VYLDSGACPGPDPGLAGTTEKDAARKAVLFIEGKVRKNLDALLGTPSWKTCVPLSGI
jgi:hypothetical protein